VNLSAGAAGLPVRRFLPLAAAAGTAWAIYNVAVGAVFGAALPGNPLLAIALSVAVAIVLGIVVDVVTQRVAARRAACPSIAQSGPNP
jgi:membrane-associated protein